MLELRIAVGAGALPPDAPLFGDPDGGWPNPYRITDRWRDAVKKRKLPRGTFHAVRLGHASPALTLNVYSHLFSNSDERAAEAIDAALGIRSGANSTESE